MKRTRGIGRLAKVPHMIPRWKAEPPYANRFTSWKRIIVALLDTCSQGRHCAYQGN